MSSSNNDIWCHAEDKARRFGLLIKQCGSGDSRINGKGSYGSNKESVSDLEISMAEFSCCTWKIIGAGTFGMLCKFQETFCISVHTVGHGERVFTASRVLARCSIRVVLPIDAMRAQLVTGRSFRNLEPTYRGLLLYVVRAIVFRKFASLEAVNGRI